MTRFGQVRSARGIGAKERYLEEGIRNMGFVSLGNYTDPRQLHWRVSSFSGLVGADRWRVSEWRLAAQQQFKRDEARDDA